MQGSGSFSLGIPEWIEYVMGTVLQNDSIDYIQRLSHTTHGIQPTYCDCIGGKRTAGCFGDPHSRYFTFHQVRQFLAGGSVMSGSVPDDDGIKRPCTIHDNANKQHCGQEASHIFVNINVILSILAFCCLL